MENKTFTSDTRLLGAIFLVVGIGTTILGQFDPEMPAFFGLFFIVGGLVFGSTKMETTLDAEKQQLSRTVWRLFFIQGKEESISYSLVESVSTARAAQKGSLSVKLTLADGRKFSLGSFGGHEAKLVAQQCSTLMGLDARVRQKLEADLDLGSISGLKTQKLEKSALLSTPGVGGSIPLSLALGALALGLVSAAIRWAPEIIIFAVGVGALIAGAAAILWRRSQAVTLEIHPEQGLRLAQPSLLGPERTSIPWSELEGLAVAEGRVNRRFLALPALEIMSDGQILRFGDGLGHEACQKVKLFIEDFSGRGQDVAGGAEAASSKGPTQLADIGKLVGASKSDLISMIKLLLLTTILGGCLASWCYPAFWSWRGQSVHTPTEFQESVELEQRPKASIPFVTHVIVKSDQSSVTFVSPLGLVEKARKRKDSQEYGRTTILFLGMPLFAAFPIFGWCLVFFGQFLQERRMVKVGFLAFFSVFPVAIGGWLIAIPLGLLAMALGWL